VLNPNSKNMHFQWKRMNLTNLISDKKIRFLRKIVDVQPIFPVNVLSYRRQNNVALHTILLYFLKFAISKMKTNKQQHDITIFF
jgi:hypothetical protein